MDAKPKILLLTHGGWGISLLKGVSMILGKVDFVSEIALLPEMTLSEYMGLVKAEVEKLPEGSVIMTDVFGGTTTNVAAKLGSEYNLKVYSGLNAPMLLEACSQLTFDGELEAQRVYEAGCEAVKDVIEDVRKAIAGKEN
ncbi:MAG: PTS sugar transporter subunit IIA [Clostridiales bacterium]|nr:PTS sugar transporter subunit IIA [Clostridiales bacterium]